MNRRSLLGASAALGLFASALTTAAETARSGRHRHQTDHAVRRIRTRGASSRSRRARPAPATRLTCAGRACSAKLGSGYEVVVEALNGRTTDLADTTVPQVSGAGLDGAAYLPAAIASHVPLDLVVIMLGTNDLKAMFKRSPLGIALGVGKLVDLAQTAGEVGTDYPAPKVLVLCPPPLGPLAPQMFADLFAGGSRSPRSSVPLSGGRHGRRGRVPRPRHADTHRRHGWCPLDRGRSAGDRGGRRRARQEDPALTADAGTPPRGALTRR